MKRWLSILLILILAACLSGCGPKNTPAGDHTEETAEPVAEATTENGNHAASPVTPPPETQDESTTFAQLSDETETTEEPVDIDSPDFRRMDLDTVSVLKLYTAAVNNVKKRTPGFTKRDDQNFTEVKAGNGRQSLANQVLNLIATEVLKSVAGNEDVSVVKPRDKAGVLRNFPVFGQEYACKLDDTSLIRSAVCYTNGSYYKIVISLADAVNPEPVISQFGKIMTPAPREEIVQQITHYFVVLDNEKFKFDFRYSDNGIVCVFNAKDGRLVYLAQDMTVKIDINLDMDLILFSTDFVKATGTAVSHVEYTDFDWSEPEEKK